MIRSILRLLFTVFAALSLLLLLATGALWVRSYFVGDWFAGQNASHAYGLGIGKGVMLVERCVALPPMSYPPQSFYHASFAPDVEREWYKARGMTWKMEGLGMRASIIDRPNMERRYGLLMPFRMLVLLWLILPVWWTILFRGRWRRERRRAAGLCLNCGYDLRSSPDRCPECGKSREIQPTPGL